MGRQIYTAGSSESLRIYLIFSALPSCLQRKFARPKFFDRKALDFRGIFGAEDEARLDALRGGEAKKHRKGWFFGGFGWLLLPYDKQEWNESRDYDHAAMLEAKISEVIIKKYGKVISD